MKEFSVPNRKIKLEMVCWIPKPFIHTSFMLFYFYLPYFMLLFTEYPVKVFTPVKFNARRLEHKMALSYRNIILNLRLEFARPISVH